MDETNSFLDLLNKPDDDPLVLIQALSAADQNAFRVSSASLEPLEPLEPLDKREEEKGEYDDDELEDEEDSDEESTEFQ